MRHKFWRFLIFGPLLILLAACEGKVTVTDKATGSTENSPGSGISFAGLDSIDNVTGSSVRLNWMNITGAAQYLIYSVSAGTPTFLTSVTAPTATATITGLNSGTTYIFRVRLVDTNGLMDANTHDLSAATNGTAAPSGLSYTANPAVYTLGVAISSNTPALSGGTATSYSISPALPTGLAFNTTTGAITGTASGIAAPGNYTVTATNAGGSATASLHLQVDFAGVSSIDNVTGSSLRLNWTSAASAVQYLVYTVSGGTATYLTTVLAPASSTTITGLNPGTNYTFRVRLMDTYLTLDANTHDVSATTVATTSPSGLTYSANPAVYSLATAITNNTPTLAAGTATSYSITPTLPTGLAFNTSTGVISGTPTVLANSASYTITATNGGGSTSVTLPIRVDFAGLSSIDNTTGVSARLNWTNVAGAAQYQVYNMTSGSPVYVTSITAPTNTYTVSGLSPTTSYSFRVRMIDTGGTTDTNTHDLSVTTSSITSTFNGWTQIKAVGPKTPAAQASDLSTSAASTTLAWAAVTPSSGSVSSYNIYRATSSGGQNYSSPLATGINSTTRSYADSTVTAGSTYYYVIAPVISGSAVIPTSTADSEVKVIVPKDNMVLLHRWAANQEMCAQMGKTSDRTSNYRCSVLTGSNAPPGTAQSGYVDLGASIFVDAYEQGCNYTYSSTVNKCGSASGCIGTLSTPNGAVTGNAGDIYYSRQSGVCYLNTSAGSGTTWTTSNTVTATQRQSMGSAAPGLPPFVMINQTGSQDVCSGQTVTGFSGTKRLPRHREQVLVGAWNSSLSDATIDTMENGSSLDATHYCNSNYASPQGNATTDLSVSNPTIAFDNNNLPTAKDSLPGCRFGDCVSTAAAIRSVRTGSNATNACVSRYGAQDVVGNVWEWSTDQTSCDNTKCVGATGVSNTVDTTNDDFYNVYFDGAQGPAVSGTFTSSGKIQFPIGIPIAGAGFTGDGVVSLTSAQFHSDYFYINVVSGARGAIAGGGWASGANSGRFALALDRAPTYTSTAFGFRCALPAE